MNFNRILVLSFCATLSLMSYAMNQEQNNDTHIIDIPLGDQNSINPQDDLLIVNNLATQQKSMMLSLVNQLKSSFSKQRSKINQNTVNSSILFFGGIFSLGLPHRPARNDLILLHLQLRIRPREQDQTEHSEKRQFGTEIKEQ